MSTQLLRFAPAALVAAALGLPLFVPDFLLFEVSIAVSYGIAILGLNLLLGFTGQICLAQGALFGVGAYTTAILNISFGLDPLATLPFAAFSAGLIGVIIGLPALRLQVLQHGKLSAGTGNLTIH